MHIDARFVEPAATVSVRHARALFDVNRAAMLHTPLAHVRRHTTHSTYGGNNVSDGALCYQIAPATEARECAFLRCPARRNRAIETVIGNRVLRNRKRRYEIVVACANSFLLPGHQAGHCRDMDQLTVTSHSASFSLCVWLWLTGCLERVFTCGISVCECIANGARSHRHTTLQ